MTHAFSLLTRLLAACLAILGLASCGSGAVSGSAPVTDPTRITILPAAATLYGGVPTTFVISGGTGSYILSSSNQSVIPVAGSINGNTVTVTPNQVGTDTEVTLTVRDTGTTPLATAALTVRPGTVSNEITITPSSTQGLNCSPAICSGGDAEVSVSLSQAGVPLANRLVRFDAITGDYRFVTSVSGSSVETLDTSINVVTDQTGRARARIRVLANASNQTALLQVTDTTSGAFQRTSFVIAQATGTSPGFFATPSSITFQGRRLEECAGTDISAVFYVFGGTPPYVIANTISTLIVRPDVVTASGGGFTVTPTGACIGVPGVPITIRDAAGRTTSVSVSNVPGTTAIPALSASPSNVNLTSCDASANIQIAGGRSGTYFVASGSDALIASVSGSTVTVRRRNPSGPSAATGSIGISDGTSVVNVTVTISGAALGSCPSAVLAAAPTTVTLTDCSTSAQVFLSGGSGSYTATASSGSIAASIAGNVLSIRRSTGSGAFSGGSVTVSDGASTIQIAVQATGAGAGSCGGGGLSANPSAVTLLDCNGAVSVSLSGATGTVTATPNTSALTASVGAFSNSVTIRRTNPSGAFGGGTVFVADSNSSVTITVSATGEAAGVCPRPPAPVSVSPTTVTLTDCSGAVQATISGGSGVFSAASSSSGITATVSGNVVSIRRANPSSAVSGATVTVSDGSTSANITVNATGSAAGSCPTPAPAITVSPSSLTLMDCNGVVQSTISGGSGSYSASSNSGSVSATVSGSILSVRRANPSSSFSGATVTVSDGSSSTSVTINATGTGAGSCPTPIGPFSVTPTSVTLNDCSGSAQVNVSGGSGTYTASSNNGSIVATISGNVASIRRATPSAATTGGTVQISDGSSPAINVTVTTSGAGAGACSSPIIATPNLIQLTDCSGPVEVSLSGGSPPYIVNSNTFSVVVTTISANRISIRRRSPSAAFTPPAIVSVTDSAGSPNTDITVNATAAGAGTCP